MSALTVACTHVPTDLLTDCVINAHRPWVSCLTPTPRQSGSARRSGESCAVPLTCHQRVSCCCCLGCHCPLFSCTQTPVSSCSVLNLPTPQKLSTSVQPPHLCVGGKWDGLAQHVTENIEDWKAVYDSSEPHRCKLPTPWHENLDGFQRMIVLRAIRPDKVGGVLVNL